MPKRSYQSDGEAQVEPVLVDGSGVRIPGANLNRQIPTGGGGGGTGTVTHTAGPLTQYAVVVGNGAADETVLASLGTAGWVLTSAGAAAPPVFAPSSGAPAGSNKQVQYNDAGAFGAKAGFEYDKATNVLTVPSLVLSTTPLAETSGGTGTASYAVGDLIYAATTTTLAKRTVGTSAQFIGVTAGLPAWKSLPVGTNLLETLVTAAPNATINAVGLTVTGPTTSTDFYLAPFGVNSAFYLGPVADNTGTGGNKRGAKAIDLQIDHSTAAAVASGAPSFTFGARNTASASSSMALGFSNTASAANATALGNTTTADGSSSLTTGSNSLARGLSGCVAGSSGNVSTGGDRQWRIFHGKVQTNDAVTVVSLTATNGTVTASSIPILSTAATAYAFTAWIVGVRSNGDSAGFRLDGIVTRPTVVGTTVVTVVPTSLGTVGTGSVCTCTAVANTVLGGVEFQVTGFAAATQGQWNCVAMLSEVKF